MISHTTIESVKELSIYDVVSRYNDIELKKAGKEWKAMSPWTSEKTPSFCVVPQKNIFKDFSSGKAGGPIQFVMDKDNLTYVDAIKSLCEQHSIKIEYENGEPSEESVSRSVEVRSALEWAAAHFVSNGIPDSFIKSRAFPEESLTPFRVGYAKAEWDDLITNAHKAGHSLETLQHADLIKKSENGGKLYDTFRDRIMMPITDYRGNVIGFTGRDAETQKKDHERPKYQHTKGVDKSHHLFGLYQAIKGRKLESGAFLVEGPLDVVRWHKHEITNTVGMQGSDFSEQQAKLLKRYTDKLTIVPDNDCDKDENKGIQAMEKNALVAIKAGFSVKILIPGIK